MTKLAVGLLSAVLLFSTAWADDTKPAETKPEAPAAQPVPPEKAPVPAKVMSMVEKAALPPATEETKEALPPAPEGVLAGGNVTEHTGALVDAAHSKEWGVLAGLVLMLVVYFVGLFWSSIPGHVLPWLSIVLGILGTVGIDMAHGLVWWKAILSGLTTGVSATGFWETLGKKIFGKRSDVVQKREEKKAAKKEEKK